MSDDPTLRGSTIAHRLYEELLVGFWADREHSREFHIERAEEYFTELAAVLGYTLTKIEPREQAA